MDSNMENKQQPGTDQQQPHRGEHQATVAESAELLKKLADFNSRKEEVMKRISAISEKMQKRINGLSTSEMVKEELEKEKMNLGIGTDHPEHSEFHSTLASTMGVQPIQKMTYTRIRETPKPVSVQGCFNIAIPSKSAITEDWKTLSKKMGDSLFESYATFEDDHISLPPGEMISIATGIKVAIPKGFIMLSQTISGLAILFPTFSSPISNKDELIFTVKNCTSGTMSLLYGVNLFTCYFLPIQENIHSDELLNSTYDDWVNGIITG